MMKTEGGRKTKKIEIKEERKMKIVEVKEKSKKGGGGRRK